MLFLACLQLWFAEQEKKKARYAPFISHEFWWIFSLRSAALSKHILVESRKIACWPCRVSQSLNKPLHHFSPHCLQHLQLLTAFSTFVPVVESSCASCQPIPGQQSQTKRQRKAWREPCNPAKPLAQLSVCRGFTISAVRNPGFPGRLAPGEVLHVLGCSTVARLAEQDELWVDELTPG